MMNSSKAKDAKRIVTIVTAAVMALGIVMMPDLTYADGIYRVKTGGYTYTNKNGKYYIPLYDGEICRTICQNTPKFKASDMTQKIYHSYSVLDGKGRAGICEGNLDQSLKPTWTRGSIREVKPTGWIQNMYSIVPGEALYNRSHLIAWRFTGYDIESVGIAKLRRNLITGTRAMNAGDGDGGMITYEEIAANYINRNSENNVLYRVTPVFRGNNLVADGVIMEGRSVDDKGAAVNYCAFVYNVQPGIAIDYLTGDSMLVKPVNLANCKISLSRNSVSYTGKARRPAAKVYSGSKGVDPATYTVSYENNTNVGTAYAVVKAKDDPCYGSKRVKFTIRPRSTSIVKVTGGKGKLTVKWQKRTKQVTGYQIRYSVKKSMASAKTKNITGCLKTKATLSKLEKNRTYYVQVRTCKNVNGKRYYSAWSEKVKKKI